MKREDFDSVINELGEPKEDTRRKSRKFKKQSEKQLMNEFYSDVEREREKSATRQRKLYENMNHLSHNEKNHFENKFTKPKNVSQDEYINLLKNKNKKIVVATGPAGTGKTLFATEYGVRNFLLGNYEKLIFTRPSVSVDEELGFLPGTLEEKMAPWVRPIYDILYNFVSPREVVAMMEDKVIEIAPLGYMRGRTFKNCWIVADEMQNSTISQMKMLLTRLGENSRLVITGDLEQYDRINELNGLEDFLSKFKGKRSSSITSFQFSRDDIQREEVVKEILEIYSAEHTMNYLPTKEEIDEEFDNDTEEKI
uniref:PhoH-like protein n=1 Tax=viral metagenome TaxID=1070528 RepID=A0A6C0KH34_9ZZZZ